MFTLFKKLRKRNQNATYFSIDFGSEQNVFDEPGPNDLRNPHLLFPQTRMMKRKFFLHVGPTNSGKTHNAIKRLSQANKAIYCAPLRLLAAEIYDKLNNEYQIPCDLVTGQQIIETPNSSHVACTIEMLKLQTPYDVAVIDEYQIISDPNRGWAWTRAILGLLAEEIHLTGDPSKVDLIRHVVSLLGEELEVIEYKRLSPLTTTECVNSLSNIREGDAVIAFSRKSVYELKRKIETATQKKCSIVYGSLPPESRKIQANSFNDPLSERKILVGTDAIGMGLNLNIGRIIFSSVRKFDGFEERFLTTSEIRQISGRAGRFNSLFPNGEVTTLYPKDLSVVRRALKPKHLACGSMHAILFPSYEQISTFADTLSPYTPFSEVLLEYERNVIVDKHFVMANIEERLKIAASIDHIPLDLEDRYTFIYSPVDSKEYLVVQAFVQFVTDYSDKIDVEFNLREMMKSHVSGRTKQQYIKELEVCHKVVELYIWLSLRFESFIDLAKAEVYLSKIETVITQTLDSIEIPKGSKRNLMSLREKRAKKRKNRGRD